MSEDCKECKVLREQRDAFQAENERLREALERYADAYNWDMEEGFSFGCDRRWETAEKALKGGE